MYSSASSYNGDWVMGVRHGMGEFVMSDGSVYRGLWANDKPHGKGTLSIPYINYTYNGNSGTVVEPSKLADDFNR